MPGKVCLNYNRVQASGVIIDHLLRQCCFVWSEIVGPHSSGNYKNKIRYEISMQENHISPCFELSSMNDTNQRGHGAGLLLRFQVAG